MSTGTSYGFWQWCSEQRFSLASMRARMRAISTSWLFTLSRAVPFAAGLE